MGSSVWGSRQWVIQQSCGDRLERCIQETSASGVKMRVSAWLLWVTVFYTCAEYSQQCKFQDICPPNTGWTGRPKTRVKEHIRHSVGHQHTAHRNRPHRRKGELLSHTADMLQPSAGQLRVFMQGLYVYLMKGEKTQESQTAVM